MSPLAPLRRATKAALRILRSRAAGVRPHPDFYGPAPLPAEPTEAEPGTPEKILILSARALRGETLWHPADAPLPPKPIDTGRAVCRGCGRVQAMRRLGLCSTCYEDPTKRRRCGRQPAA